MNDTPETVSADIVDLGSFAARLRHDVDTVLQPALDAVDGDVGAVLAGDRPNQALGNHDLNPAAQWIGAAIEINIRESADHLRSLISSMEFMAELAEAIARDYGTIDEQNQMDVSAIADYVRQVNQSAGPRADEPAEPV
ncbi:MAG: hypothetical protein ACRDXX_12220 [Stackebrandtia sp.]